jgi:alginate O-acetyltransferase complex protein AlgI
MDLTWFCASAYAVSLLAVGYGLPFIKEKRIARTCSWIVVLTTIVFSTAVTLHETPLMRMLIIVFLQLLSMKNVVAVETYSGINRLKTLQWVSFALGWFGMRPVLFEKLSAASLPFTSLAWKGISRVIVGILVLYLANRLESNTTLTMLFIPQLLLLLGLSLILHFGILNLSAAGWRAMGVDVSELFRSPYKSRSLKEFWGRRWNIAFSEMTALIAYRPLKSKIGMTSAMIVSFLLSGLLHEIAISFPVKSGYGKPMVYFVIHAIAMQLEAKSSIVQRMIQHKIFCHLWVMTLLIAPMPLLFHDEFIHEVLAPLSAAILRSVTLA